MTADLDRSRRYLKPVPRLALPGEPDVVHLALYGWEDRLDAWVASSPALCGRSAQQGDLPMDAEVTCPGCLDLRAGYQAELDRRAAARAHLRDLGAQPEDDDTTEADRPGKLADQLAGIYDYTRLTELEKDDPQRAQEHRDAAHELVGWFTGAPREERCAAFSRGWERAKERRNELAERRIGELEDLLAAASPETDRTPSRIAPSRAEARQDPRFDLVFREAMALDRYDGTPVIPQPLANLLAARVVSAIRAYEATAQQSGCRECGHPEDQHVEADEPVSVGQCLQCAAEPDSEDDSWHNYQGRAE